MLGCVGCQYHANDWRLCLHPLSAVPSFWADTSDYSCFTPVATGKKFCGSQPQQNPARINVRSTSSADLMPAKRQNFTPKLVSQNQTKPARVVWGVQTSPEYVAWCGSKGYAESFLQKVIFAQSGEIAPGAAGAQTQASAQLASGVICETDPDGNINQHEHDERGDN